MGEIVNLADRRKKRDEEQTVEERLSSIDDKVEQLKEIFKKAEEQNRKNKERLERDRRKRNETVTKQYRLKKDTE